MNNSFLGSNEEILLNYTKIHKILMDYLKKKQNEESIVTWISNNGHKMKAILRETNLNENLQKNYSNDNILKLPILNTFDITENIKISTLTRISIFSKDLKIDGIPIISKYYYKNINKKNNIIKENYIITNSKKSFNENNINPINKNITYIKKNSINPLMATYIKLHKILMRYPAGIPIPIQWTSKAGHEMEALFRKTDINKNLNQSYSNDNPFKLPISNAIDITANIKMPTLTRISIFAKDLYIGRHTPTNWILKDEGVEIKKKKQTTDHDLYE